MSAEDIDAGARWSQVLDRKLNEFAFGVICLTGENQDAPWITFEAGALAKAIASDPEQQPRVCPYLIDLKASDLAQGPLTQFQAKQADEPGTRGLLNAINLAAGDKALGAGVLDRAFTRCWPELKNKLESLPQTQTPGTRRPAEEMLEEILVATREVVRFQRRQASQEEARAAACYAQRRRPAPLWEGPERSEHDQRWVHWRRVLNGLRVRSDFDREMYRFGKEDIPGTDSYRVSIAHRNEAGELGWVREVEVAPSRSSPVEVVQTIVALLSEDDSKAP